MRSLAGYSGPAFAGGARMDGRRKARVLWYLRVRAACLHAAYSMQTSQKNSMDWCAQLKYPPRGLCRCKCTCNMLVTDDRAAA